MADLRDLWTTDPHRYVPRALRWFDRRLERRTLAGASAATTVADVLAEDLRSLVPGIPVTAIRNGFDDAWLRHGDDPPRRPPRVVYTGTLTDNTGRGANSMLALAHGLARQTSPEPVHLDVFGSTSAGVRDALGDPSLRSVVTLHGPVTADQVRAVQHDAAVLLNIAWDDPRDHIACPAKLFEYAAARRPIVNIARTESVGTRLIRDHRLGFVCDPDDEQAITALVHGLATGAVPWTPPAPGALAPLSQRNMTAQFVPVLESVLR